MFVFFCASVSTLRGLLPDSRGGGHQTITESQGFLFKKGAVFTIAEFACL